MGVLANHVPSVEQLRPGVIEIIEENAQASKQFFGTPSAWLSRRGSGSSLCTGVLVSGGFAVVQPNSQLSINAVEAFPIDEFSVEAVRAQLAESQKVANGNGSEADIAEAKIEVEVRSSGYGDGGDVCWWGHRFSRLFRLPWNKQFLMM
jgi:F-type H+-transporting ATPase subunit delta